MRLMLAASLVLAVTAAGPALQHGDAIEGHRRALAANPDDAAAKIALKRMIDRANPVPRDEDERIREILRRYPWPGSMSLALAEEPGERLIVSGFVRDDAGRPVEGAVLSVFQADANGHYTRAAAMDEPHARLFGFLRTGADGRFELTTIRPGGYPGRPDRQGEEWRIPAHVHFHVTAAGHRPRGFQMVFKDDPRMTPRWHAWAASGNHPIVEAVHGSDGVQRAACDITLTKAGALASR